MSEHHLIFHQVFAHCFPLVPGQTTYTIFEDSGRGTDESITRLTEQEIVEWIFKDRLTRGHFLRTIIPGATEFCHFLCVQKPVIEYSQKPGDIDILMWPKGRPDLAIAIECKRAKVVVEPNGKEKVNRLSKIDKGIRQVNELRELGFHIRNTFWNPESVSSKRLLNNSYIKNIRTIPL